MFENKIQLWLFLPLIKLSFGYFLFSIFLDVLSFESRFAYARLTLTRLTIKLQAESEINERIQKDKGGLIIVYVPNIL